MRDFSYKMQQMRDFSCKNQGREPGRPPTKIPPTKKIANLISPPIVLNQELNITSGKPSCLTGWRFKVASLKDNPKESKFRRLRPGCILDKHDSSWGLGLEIGSMHSWDLCRQGSKDWRVFPSYPNLNIPLQEPKQWEAKERPSSPWGCTWIAWISILDF